MDVETAVNSFIQLYEFLPTDETPLNEPVVVTFPATHHNSEWTIVLNGDPTESHDVEDIPTPDSTITVQPTQALVFLGERHAGIIGAGAGELYGDQFDTAAESLQEAFLTDFATEFK